MTKEEKFKKAEIALKEYKEEKKRIIDENLKLKGITKAKFYFPITKLMLGAMILTSGEHLTYLNERNVKTPKGRPVIYANTHKFKPDIERLSYSLNKPSAFMASDFKNSYKTIAGWYFNTRPTVYVDPYDKTDRSYSYKMMVRYLKEMGYFMEFPEAVWNLSSYKMVLDVFSGTVRAALETDAVIVCSAIERYGKEFVINRKGYLDLNDVLKKYTDKSFEEINNNSEYANLRRKIISESSILLRDNLATLTYEIWENHAEKYSVESRENLGDDYWEKFIKSLTDEWPGYKLSDNIEQQVQNKREIEQVSIERDINNLKNNLNINNLFLFTDYDRYLRAKQLIEKYDKSEEQKVKILK